MAGDCWSYNSLTQRYNEEDDSDNSCSNLQTDATTALLKFTPMRHSDGLLCPSLLSLLFYSNALGFIKLYKNSQINLSFLLYCFQSTTSMYLMKKNISELFIVLCKCRWHIKITQMHFYFCCPLDPSFSLHPVKYWKVCITIAAICISQYLGYYEVFIFSLQTAM